MTTAARAMQLSQSKHLQQSIITVETQLKRLDLADRAFTTDAQGHLQVNDFTSQPPLAYCFDQFTAQMLPEKSKATNLIDLQAELNAA